MSVRLSSAVHAGNIYALFCGAAPDCGCDSEEMEGRSCLAWLDHPSSLSLRIGKKGKAAEAIYLLSHRGEGGRRGEERRRGRKEARERERERREKKLLILKSSPASNPRFSLSFSSDNLCTKRGASSFRFIRENNKSIKKRTQTVRS